MQGKTAVVTGGASGIGAATVELLAREGARVAILDINAECAHVVAARTGALAVPCDVSIEEQVQAAINRVASEFGHIDALVNNAGIPARRPVGEMDTETWRQVFEVHVQGAFLCSRCALPHFGPAGGSIVHMSSVTGITGVRSRSAYSSAKGALVALARQMAVDYAGRGIRVNAVCPGFVKTPLIRALLADPERTAKLTRLHPLGRLGEPEDIARAVVFLLSEESAWITGQALAVDGGFSCGHADEI